jgi:hypothetical protein
MFPFTGREVYEMVMRKVKEVDEIIIKERAKMPPEPQPEQKSGATAKKRPMKSEQERTLAAMRRDLVNSKPDLVKNLILFWLLAIRGEVQSRCDHDG